MVRRRKAPRARAADGRLSGEAAGAPLQRSALPPDSPFPTLEAFVLHDGGQICLGEIGPIACAAVANDQHSMYAALRRLDGESLSHLMQRLDAALLRALEHDVFTDEINDRRIKVP